MGSPQAGSGQSDPTRLLFVGGIHGGYEYNSVLLSYRLIDYLKANPQVVPKNVVISVIPQANPDGVSAVTGVDGRFTRADIPKDSDPGGAERFNANGVDLNRNFACNWKSTSLWRGNEVDAGASAFSEPESQVLRDYVWKQTSTGGRQANFDAAVFFHSAAGAVYGAACGGAVGPKTQSLLQTYADAAGYRAVTRFDAYPITGDAESWMTKLNIPAVSVELTNHQDTEWQKNLAGIKAVIDHFR
jgi:hypothetical protein